jgi:hypothetical protein
MRQLSSSNHNQSKTMPTLLHLDASPRGDFSAADTSIVARANQSISG